LFDAFLRELLITQGALVFMGIISFAFILISTLIYKYVSDQVTIKHLRSELDKLKEKMKKHRSDQSKMMEINKMMMTLNGSIFKHSWKSNMVPGLLFAFLILPWLSANLAFAPLVQDVPFNMTVTFDNYVGVASVIVPAGMSVDISTKNVSGIETWQLLGKEGEYSVLLNVDGKEYSKDVVISDTVYAKPVQVINDGVVKSIALPQQKRIILPWSVFGWNGWFFTYFLFSIVFSIILRKLLKVY